MRCRGDTWLQALPWMWVPNSTPNFTTPGMSQHAPQFLPQRLAFQTFWPSPALFPNFPMPFMAAQAAYPPHQQQQRQYPRAPEPQQHPGHMRWSGATAGQAGSQPQAAYQPVIEEVLANGFSSGTSSVINGAEPPGLSRPRLPLEPNPSQSLGPPLPPALGQPASRRPAADIDGMPAEDLPSVVQDLLPSEPQEPCPDVLGFIYCPLTGARHLTLRSLRINWPKVLVRVHRREGS